MVVGWLVIGWLKAKPPNRPTTSVPAIATLKMLSPGLCTLRVDRGRPRTRSLGVPVGGAADSFSLALGNALVGNPPDTTALEVLLSTVKELQSQGVTVAFARVRDQVRERMRLAGVEAAVGLQNFHERVTDGVRAWQRKESTGS